MRFSQQVQQGGWSLIRTSMTDDIRERPSTGDEGKPRFPWTSKGDVCSRRYSDWEAEFAHSDELWALKRRERLGGFCWRQKVKKSRNFQCCVKRKVCYHLERRRIPSLCARVCSKNDLIEYTVTIYGVSWSFLSSFSHSKRWRFLVANVSSRYNLKSLTTSVYPSRNAYL